MISDDSKRDCHNDDCRQHYLSPKVQRHHSANEPALVDAVTTRLITACSQLHQEQQHVTLAVSGGKSPTALFKRLATCVDIAWDAASVTLVDERYVAPDHPDSNENLLRTHLCQQSAANIRLVGLYASQRNCAEQVAHLNREPPVPLPDIAILGLGMDGHTASLFPCSPEYHKNLTTTARYVKATPQTAPHERISLSANALIKVPALWMYLAGEEKYQRLLQILEGKDPSSPLNTILRQRRTPMAVFTCP